MDRRTEESRDQGLAKVDERLYCQPCEKFIHHKKTTVKRHLGMLSVYILHSSFHVFFCVVGLKMHQMPIKHDLLSFYKIMVRAAK